MEMSVHTTTDAQIGSGDSTAASSIDNQGAQHERQQHAEVEAIL